MTQALTLLSMDRPQLTVAAGWLASPDPQDWLREIASCRAQGCDLAIYPVAASVAKPRAVGVFLFPRSGKPKFHPRVQPFAEIAPSVYAPLDATLSAGLLENERRFFFSYHVHFFHPTLGLIGFDLKDELPPVHLLARPTERGHHWNCAIPVEKFSPVLHALVVTAPPDPQQILDEAAQDIGKKSGGLLKDTDGLLDKAGMIGKGIAGGLLLGAGWLFQRFHKSAPTGSPEKLLDWAKKNWNQITDRRNREIDRLLEMMEKNPDQGLRYALPLTGTEQSRGTAPPSWQLGQNNTNFSLGHGGGAIDGWDIANEARLKLEQQYRDAAQREISLGRYERAAYIYGNLLGDWPSAAKALADAGMHREAVAIYLHKLNNRKAAAQYLEKAGLLLQAAAIYAEAKQYEKAGDLHARLGNETQAMELWHAELEAQRDPLQKARLLSTKLKDRPAAIQLLDATWKSGDRPDAALAAMFTILREDENLPAALQSLREIFELPITGLPLANKLNFSHQEAMRWSEPIFMEKLKQYAYQNIGHALITQNNGTSALLEFIPKLENTDIILARDARRYSLQKNPPKIPTSGPPRGILRPQHIIPISTDTRWDSLATTPKGVSIAGYGKDMLAVAQFRDNACRSSALRIPDDPGNTEVRHVIVSSQRGSSRLFYFPYLKRICYLPLDRAPTEADHAIATLRNILAVAPIGRNGEFAILEYTAAASLVLHQYSEAAVRKSSYPIDLAPPDVIGLDWHIAGSKKHFCFTAIGFLAWRHPDGQFSTVNLGQTPATSLQLSPLTNTKNALITFADEVLLIVIGKPGKTPETINLFSAEVSRPQACYLLDGCIVIAHSDGGVIYPPSDFVTPSATLSFPADSGIPIAIAPRGDGRFAILTNKGNLLVFAR